VAFPQLLTLCFKIKNKNLFSHILVSLGFQFCFYPKETQLFIRKIDIKEKRRMPQMSTKTSYKRYDLPILMSPIEFAKKNRSIMKMAFWNPTIMHMSKASILDQILFLLPHA
jgi:hypothetical protein